MRLKPILGGQDVSKQTSEIRSFDNVGGGRVEFDICAGSNDNDGYEPTIRRDKPLLEYTW